MTANWPIPCAKVGSRRTAARVTLGAISLSSSGHFPHRLYSNINKAGSVAAGPRQTLNKSGAYGVRHYDKDNWNGASSFQHHLCRGAATSQNDVWGKRD